MVRLSRFFSLVCGVALCIFASESAMARSKYEVVVQRGFTIEGLKLREDRLDLKSVQRKGRKLRYVRLQGRYARKGWVLRFKNKTIVGRRSSKRTFSIKIPIKRKELKLGLVAYGPGRRKEKEVLIFRVERNRQQDVKPVARDREPKKEILTARNEKSWRLHLGVGGTSLSYTESGIPDYSGLLITPKVGAWFKLAERWDIDVNGYANLLAVSNDPSDSSVQFFGMNGRVGYLILSQSSFDFTMSAGLYFVTTSASNTAGAFGFQNLIGLQFYPSFRFKLSDRNSVSLYAKYSPILGLSLADRELAFGTAFVHQLRNGDLVSIGLDFANTSFLINATLIESTALNLGVTYSF